MQLLEEDIHLNVIVEDTEEVFAEVIAEEDIIIQEEEEEDLIEEGEVHLDAEVLTEEGVLQDPGQDQDHDLHLGEGREVILHLGLVLL